MTMVYKKDKQIFRYDEINLVSSNLDPIEDMFILIKSLKSEGYVNELLSSIHNFKDASLKKRTAKSISKYIDVSLKLFDQGMSSHSEVSFLPLYYSMLNLSKVQILFGGGYDDLKDNKAHGASYSENQMAKRKFLNEEISLKRKGSINLLHRSLTGINLPSSTIKIDDLYQNLHDMSAEYSTITGKNISKQICNFYFDQDDDGFFIKTVKYVMSEEKRDLDIMKIKAVDSPQFWTKKITNNYFPGESDSYWFETRHISGDFSQVKNSLLRYLKRSYLVTIISNNGWSGRLTNTYVQLMSNKQMILPEEVNILLAFFHLSNIVRYNPEHLDKLMNGKHSMLINVLQKHGFLRYLKLFWSNVTRSNFDITTN